MGDTKESEPDYSLLDEESDGENIEGHNIVRGIDAPVTLKIKVEENNHTTKISKKSRHRPDKETKIRTTYCNKCKKRFQNKGYESHDCKPLSNDLFAKYGQDIEDYVEVCIEEGVRKFKCKNCDYVTKASYNIKSHCLYKHVSKGEVSCDICGKIAKSLGSLIEHKSMHHHNEDGKKKCCRCKKLFSEEEYRVHKCGKAICSECGKILSSKSNLKHHILNKHTNNEKVKSHYCSECGMGFTEKNVLTKHMKTHVEKSPCPECGAKVRNLKDHILISHTPDELKEFQCKHCGKGFIRKKTLDQHMMNMHLKLRPYKCRYGCDISYNDQSNRNQHERRQHGKAWQAKMDV